MKLQAFFLLWTMYFVWLVKADSHICGHRTHVPARTKRVVGGREATPNSWPWMVNFINLKSQQYCAGTVIDREWILTAAHCLELDSLPNFNYTFHIADHNLNISDPEEYEIHLPSAKSKIFVHPKYVIGNILGPGDYDIALVKLSKPLNYSENVQPICLAEENDIFSENETCYLTGWGNIENKSGLHRSPFLKEVKLDLVELEECNSDTSYKDVVPDRFLCAGFKEGGKDGCYGDSGGPLQCDRNGTWIQIGIMIWGRGCAQPNHYGVYTDIKVLQPFIKMIRAGPNSNMTSYLKEALGEKRSSNLYDLFTNEKEFSEFDLVRNFQLFPYQIDLLNQTTSEDLEFVSSTQNLTANTTMLTYIAEVFVKNSQRLYIYSKSKELTKEFNITFDAIYKSANLTEQELLNSKFNIIEEIGKRLYFERYIKQLENYKDTLMTYKPGLEIAFDIASIKKDLDASTAYLKNLQTISLKQIIVKYNRMVFTKMISIRNISSFFETNLTILKNTTVTDVLIHYLFLHPVKFASLHDLTSRDTDVLAMKKISTVSNPDDESLYDLAMKILESHSNSFACGVRNDRVRSRRKRVIGGDEATENSWPWMVSFVEMNGLQYCAGSIIGRKWILTAAHCLVLQDGVISLKHYTYYVGDHRLNITDPHEYTVEASKLLIHPQYNAINVDYDIALIELSRPLTFSEYVRPVCLVEEDISMNSTCYLSGWGNTKNNHSYHRSPVLREVRLDLVSLEECNSNTSYNGNVTARSFCAGFKEGGKDGCYGDSGGPLQCDRNGSWVQIGVVSWGRECAQPNYFGVYSDVKLLLPFINAVRSGPNSNLTAYHLKTLDQLIATISERSTKILHQLLTNDKQFSDIDLVRNLQLSPNQFAILNRTTLQNLESVSNKHNLTANKTNVKYIVQVFINQTDRLDIYLKGFDLAKQLNISFDDVIQLSGLTKETFLDSKPKIIDEVKKTFEINKLLEKLKEFKQNVMAYRSNLNVTFDEEKARKDLNMYSLKEVENMKEKTLKQIIVEQNMMLFTKTFTIQNISTFFGIPRDNLRNMTVPTLLTEVLAIDLDNYTALHMFTAQQLDVIEFERISSVDQSSEKSLYEITNAILHDKEITNRCNEQSCLKNAECIQNSNFSFSCRCKKGYIGGGFLCETGNQIYSSELVLNQTFTESLNNPKSAAYIDLAEDIQNGLTSAIKMEDNLPGFLGVQVTSFLKGSVIAKFIIVFQTNEILNVSKITRVIDVAIQNGSLLFPALSSKPLKSADLCSLGFHNCHADATCSLENGILACKCKENFYGDGESCVDPCRNHQCYANSYCFRGLKGEAKCICDTGYTQDDGECEKREDLKTALIVVSCVAGTLLLLTLLVCWYQYCNKNRNKSVEIQSTKVTARGQQNTAYDTMNMDSL